MEDIIIIIGEENAWVFLKFWAVAACIAVFVKIVKSLPPAKDSIAYKRVHGYGRKEE